ncbi:MAG TPA: 2-dehydropantoate 2-reductase N-terminal domain-containing protein [Kofleriaceae bacterium]|nr:2-dehydropantoate 2-reductase N-terminal domain-containing protein [Kofleriaceae bacterium]
MRVLIVGAGAVGQVFGHHLAQGGAEVSFLVKPKYADELRPGVTLYPLDRKPPRAQRFTGFGVLTAPGDAAGSRWDYILLTVSSTALTSGGWLAELAAATGDAAIVFLQPNLEDRGFVTRVVDPRRIVDGMIGFIAYHAPLPGETRFAEPGVAYWSPPGPSPFSGERAGALVAALRRGKLPARQVRDVTASAPFQSAALYAYLVALESAGWSLAELRRGGRLSLAGRAAAQALAIASHRVGHRVPWTVRLAARPLVIGLVLRLARRVVPIDLETYLRVHFTKFGAQTRAGIQSYVDHGGKNGLPVDAIERLATASLPAA